MLDLVVDREARDRMNGSETAVDAFLQERGFTPFARQKIVKGVRATMRGSFVLADQNPDRAFDDTPLP
jgi:hypothetical protein